MLTLGRCGSKSRGGRAAHPVELFAFVAEIQRRAKLGHLGPLLGSLNSGPFQSRIRLRGQSKIDPTPAFLNRMLQHLPALRGTCRPRWGLLAAYFRVVARRVFSIVA